MFALRTQIWADVSFKDNNNWLNGMHECLPTYLYSLVTLLIIFLPLFFLPRCYQQLPTYTLWVSLSFCVVTTASSFLIPASSNPLIQKFWKCLEHATPHHGFDHFHLLTRHREITTLGMVTPWHLNQKHSTYDCSALSSTF